MNESSSEFSAYQHIKVEPRRVEDYAVVTVEVPDLKEGRYKRDHRRIIGGLETPAKGRTIIYSDTYTDAPRPTTYAYARHDVNQDKFFSLLQEFISGAILVDFPELRNSRARCVIQSSEGLRHAEFESYFSAVSSLKETPLTFARLYFVFGDITVEFRPTPSLVGGELSSVSRGILPRAVESPLIAFDVSNSDIWLSFLMSVHWARDLFPSDVLRSIVGMAAPATVA